MIIKNQLKLPQIPQIQLKNKTARLQDQPLLFAESIQTSRSYQHKLLSRIDFDFRNGKGFPKMHLI